MAKKSAGILAYRIKNNVAEVLLVHPGGPLFARKDMGVWSVPKGEYDNTEDAFAAAKREFAEETGMHVDGHFLPLSPVKLKSGKLVTAWAVAADLNTQEFFSNTFTMQWPPGSGNLKVFPEVDKAEWFTFIVAKEKINSGQIPLIDELGALITGH